MKHIAGWFRRNNTIMAQAKDLSRQLQEAWIDKETWRAKAELQRELRIEAANGKAHIIMELHRVARERDQERKKRLAAEDALLDMYLDNEEE